MNTSTHNIVRIETEGIENSKGSYWQSIYTYDTQGNWDQMTIHFENEDHAEEHALISQAQHNMTSNAVSFAIVRATDEFQVRCMFQLDRNPDNLDRLPGPDHCAKVINDAVEALNDMLNQYGDESNVMRARQYVIMIGDVRKEWAKWENASQAELALCDALIASMKLFGMRYANENFMSTFTDAIKGFATWDALDWS